MQVSRVTSFLTWISHLCITIEIKGITIKLSFTLVSQHASQWKSFRCYFKYFLTVQSWLQFFIKLNKLPLILLKSYDWSLLNCSFFVNSHYILLIFADIFKTFIEIENNVFLGRTSSNNISHSVIGSLILMLSYVFWNVLWNFKKIN